MDTTSLIGHNHTTTKLTKTTDDAYCRFCWSIAYRRCIKCQLVMCKICIKLPQEASHGLHPQHPLRMYNPCSLQLTEQFLLTMSEPCLLEMREPFIEKGICQGCNHFLCYHKCYKCTVCEFRLCVECFTSTTSRRPLQWENKTIPHYSHLHELTKCRFREVLAAPTCWICELQMWGVGYACVRCLHFIHESCIGTPQVIQHPFHPLHPLRRLDYNSSDGFNGSCNACQGFSYSGVDGLRCYDCKFYLHSRCASHVLRMVKVENHIHGLICVHWFSKTECPICGMHFGQGQRYPILRCVECDLNFHFHCISIPRSFSHGHHQHTLTLVRPCDDYISDEYYCDVCEARRDSNCYAYRCEQCNFFGHIECLLSKEEGFPQFWLSLDLEPKQLNKTELQKPSDYSSDKQIQRACHYHPLNLKIATNRCCCMCQIEINGRAYSCEKCDREFLVHEQCAELPENLDHPLHPSHRLSLLKSYQLNRGYFICSLCSEITQRFNFSCRTCDFVIDIRCALTIEAGQPFDDKEYRKSLRHIVHDHELTLANARRDTRLKLSCDICTALCSGLTYCCMKCSFYAHRACMEWPSVAEPHPLHPDHRLMLSRFGYTECECYACGDLISILGYKCEKYGAPNRSCRVDFHLECGISLARLLKQKHHNHHFYYFHEIPWKGVGLSDIEVCSICKKRTKDSYYRCHKCKLHFHLRCLRLPQNAKHKWHLHLLTFKDSIDYGGYYCDICEEPRDFQHPVYYCKECNFVAHVECIVSKENASSVTLEEIESDHEDIPECLLASTLEEIESDNEDDSDNEDIPKCSLASTMEEIESDNEDILKGSLASTLEEIESDSEDIL